MKSLISCHRGAKESKNEYRHLSILKSLSSHNDNWGFFIPQNKAVTLSKGFIVILYHNHCPNEADMFEKKELVRTLITRVRQSDSSAADICELYLKYGDKRYVEKN